MKIKKIPWWINLIFFRGPKGLALMDTIYLSEHFYELFTKKIVSVKLEALIAHESTHAERFKKTGWRGIVKYFLFSSFRLQEEIAATSAEIAVFKKHLSRFDYQGRARSWSSINYFFMTTYEEALDTLLSL